MSLSTWKPVACRIPPVNGANGSHSEVSKVTMMNNRQHSLPPLQVKEKEKTVMQESSTTATSRREMMHLTAASLGLLALLTPAPAEARARNATIRQKIMEKFEALRQKAGLSKPKDEEKKPEAELQDKTETKDGHEEETKPKMKNGGEGKKPETTPEHSITPKNEELSVPALPSILNGKVIETTLP